MPVWYPAAWRSFATVGCCPSNRLKTGTPFLCEYRPVRIDARLGVQIEFVTKVLRNSMPSRARRSICGVSFTREPYAEIAWAAWSSVMMKRMFGRRGEGGTAGAAASKASARVDSMADCTQGRAARATTCVGRRPPP